MPEDAVTLRHPIRHMDRTVTVLLQRPTPRAIHAVELVLLDMLGWQVRHVQHADELLQASGPKLWYGEQPLDGAFHVAPCGALHRPDGMAHDPPVGHVQDMPVLFPGTDGGMPFDVFAATFWLLARCEEYGPMERDAHGRPLTAALLAARHGFLERPVVDEWALALEEAWRPHEPELPAPVRQYAHTATIDLDNGFMFRGRPLWRTMGAWARDMLRGNWSDVRDRPRVLLGSRDDPYDVLPGVLPWMHEAASRVLVFVLNAPRGEHDHAVPISYPPYAERLRQVARTAEVGIHPSYHSSTHPERIPAETRGLAAVLQRPVVCSRQHFLRSDLPHTFRALEAAGIREEHSMGLHDRPGFRAGTCTPYRWYDLLEDRATALRIHPFTVMDNGLRDKMGLAPEAAEATIAPTIERIRQVRGTFTGLWHEGFLSGHPRHAGWREAIRGITLSARP
jgi:hypothetical protein